MCRNAALLLTAREELPNSNTVLLMDVLLGKLQLTEKIGLDIGYPMCQKIWTRINGKPLRNTKTSFTAPTTASASTANKAKVIVKLP
jgi:hypothetical protein